MILYGTINSCTATLRPRRKYVVIQKNPAYGRHQLSRPMRIVAPIFLLGADSRRRRPPSRRRRRLRRQPVVNRRQPMRGRDLIM